jgi:hypothetical protein
MFIDKYAPKNPIIVNLQRFASDDEPDIDGIELDTSEGVEIEVENDDERNDEAGQEDTEESAEEAGKENQEVLTQPERTVPLKALEAERKKWQERLKEQEKFVKAAQKLTSATGKDIDSLLNEMDQIEMQKHVESGMNEKQAREFVEMRRKIEETQLQMNKQKYDAEFMGLKNNSFYSDAETYREELEAFANRTGLNIKQAYNALYGDLKYADMERTIEQRILNNQQKKQSKAIDTTPTAHVAAKPKVNLTQDQIDLAKMAGMTPQEYYNMLNTKSLDKYQKLKKG